MIGARSMNENMEILQNMKLVPTENENINKGYSVLFVFDSIWINWSFKCRGIQRSRSKKWLKKFSGWTWLVPNSPDLYDHLLVNDDLELETHCGKIEDDDSNSWASDDGVLASWSFPKVSSWEPVGVHSSSGRARLRCGYSFTSRKCCVETFPLGGDVDISSYSCARWRFIWKGQATNHPDIKLLSRRVMWWIGTCEYIARLKLEQRSLKLSLLDFFLCFIAFSCIHEIPHLRSRV